MNKGREIKLLFFLFLIYLTDKFIKNSHYVFDYVYIYIYLMCVYMSYIFASVCLNISEWIAEMIQGTRGRKWNYFVMLRHFPAGASGKEHACQCRRLKRHGFNPWVRKIPWSRKWQPNSSPLAGESHRQRSLVGCSPWGHKELDSTEAKQASKVRTPLKVDFLIC